MVLTVTSDEIEALHKAAERGDIRALDTQLAAIVDREKVTKADVIVKAVSKDEQFTVHHKAASLGLTEIVTHFHQSYIFTNQTGLLKSFLNDRSKNGDTAFYQGAKNGHKEFVQKLAEMGANLDLPTVWGWTPVHAAVNSKDPTMLRVLLALGCNAKKLSLSNEAPLHIAAHVGDVARAEALLDTGLDAMVKNEAGNTAIDIAMEGDKQDLVACFLNRGY